MRSVRIDESCKETVLSSRTTCLVQFGNIRFGLLVLYACFIFCINIYLIILQVVAGCWLYTVYQFRQTQQLMADSKDVAVASEGKTIGTAGESFLFICVSFNVVLF